MTDAPHIQLIAGLGNPGDKYARTRHNAGFWFVDRLAARDGAPWREESKFRGFVTRVRVAGHELWLIKPQTFMNLSGDAVRAMASFYKIPTAHILVVHDEIDLPPGTIRLKRGGGHGGHNGLRDLVAKTGKDFLRLRVGVGRPEHASQVTNYVLKPPSQDDRILIERTLDDGERAVDILVADGLEKAMHRLHSRPDEPSCAPRERRARGQEGPAATPARAGAKAARAPAQRRREADDEEAGEPRSLKDQLLGLFRRD